MQINSYYQLLTTRGRAGTDAALLKEFELFNVVVELPPTNNFKEISKNILKSNMHRIYIVYSYNTFLISHLPGRLLD